MTHPKKRYSWSSKWSRKWSSKISDIATDPANTQLIIRGSCQQICWIGPATLLDRVSKFAGSGQQKKIWVSCCWITLLDRCWITSDQATVQQLIQQMIQQMTVLIHQLQLKSSWITTFCLIQQEKHHVLTLNIPTHKFTFFSYCNTIISSIWNHK